METGANITAAMFAAYLKCRTKAYLTAHREKPPEPVFVEMRKRVSAAYKAQRPNTESTVPINFSRLADGLMDDAATVVVDCETVSYTYEGSAPASVDPRAKRADSGRQNVPILYSAWDKTDQSDDLLVCFGALAIAQATGISSAIAAKVFVYGPARYRATSNLRQSGGAAHANQCRFRQKRWCMCRDPIAPATLRSLEPFAAPLPSELSTEPFWSHSTDDLRARQAARPPPRGPAV
jgi:hypothetical protein